MKTRDSLVVGVTGGIGSGKSEVCGMFERLGGFVVSADDLAKRMMEENPLLRRRIIKAFGDDAYSGEGKLNRTKLAAVVFSDPLKKLALDALVHPIVLDELARIIRRQRRNHHLLFVEAALIYESGADSLMDYVVVVDADREACIRRVMNRDSASRTDVLQRLDSQMDPREKLRLADFVVLNNQDLTFLQRRVAFLHRLFTLLVGQ